MACGLALMMGFVLIQNFDSPYQAESITDFWRRWHISLSTWLRDYLYIPLGGNRRGNVRTYVNLMLVMLIGGLWHGASWNFVIWGGIHGSMLAFERMQGKKSYYRRLPPLRVAITFGIVCFTWVFFRQDAAPGSVYVLLPVWFGTGSAAVMRSWRRCYTQYHLMIFFIAASLVWLAPDRGLLAADHFGSGIFAGALMVLACCFMWTQSENPFIYFQF